MKKVFLFTLASLLVSSLFAHEYVMLAYKFVVSKGEKLEIHLFVADGYNVIMERSMQKNITKSFTLISENGTEDLLPEINEETLPILNKTVEFSGLGLLTMERDYAKITLPNEKFKSYLKEDNIENIIIDEINKTEQRERYTRYLKTLVQSDLKQNDSLFNTNVGHDFEIVLLQNPYLLTGGDTLEARVYFKGKPLSNKTITARNREGNKAATVQYSKTNKDGLCRFKLDRKGDWFLHATHMIKSTNKEEADWESFWTTYSFGMK